MLKHLHILLPFYMFELPFVAVKNMSSGMGAADYLLAKNENDPTDYYMKESLGHIYDPHHLLFEFGIKNGSIINEDDFKNLCAGLNPRNFEPLLKVHGDNHRAGTDFAFSAPKSYSALWALSSTNMRNVLEEINAEAVRKALDFLNEKATTRIGGGGNETIKAKFVAIQFQHGANRNQDPHLHLHNPILNLTKSSDGKWRTLEPRSLFKFQTAADSIYQAHLIKSLQEKFPNIEITVTENGHSFEINNVPRGLVEDWSGRRNEMLEKAKHDGIQIDDVGSLDRIFYETRQKKVVIEDPHHQWNEYAKQHHGFSNQDVEFLLNNKNPNVEKGKLTKEDIQLKLTSAIGKLLNTESVVNENQLIRAISEEFFGDFDGDQVLRTFDKLKSGELKLLNADEVMHVGEHDGMSYFSTKSMQSIEKRAICILGLEI